MKKHNILLVLIMSLVTIFGVTLSVNAEVEQLSMSVEHESTISCGQEVEFTLVCNGGSGDYKYLLNRVSKVESETKTSIDTNEQEYQTSNVIKYTFEEEGTYQLEFVVVDENTKEKITLTEDVIVRVDVQKLASEIYSSLNTTSSSSSKIVVTIDPGHGLWDPGACYYGMEERNINYDIALALKEELEAYGIEVHLTRTRDGRANMSSDDGGAELRARADIAQCYDSDLLISIHNNAGGGQGTEVYYPAARSYYPEAYTVGSAVASKISTSLGQIGLYQRKVVSKLDEGEPLLYYDNGELADYYGIIRYSRMRGIPAVLVECAYMDNASDAAKLQDASFLKQIGVSIASAVADYFGATKEPKNVEYTTHVQNIGWQSYVADGEMAGTQGQSLRLEGIKIKKGDNLSEYSGAIEYQTHIQNIGWETSWSSNDTMSGTSGLALRLEAIRIRLTGDLADAYDVYYRVHAQNVGWMGWAKNGQSAGTAGFAYRLEGIQIVLVPKGGEAPGSTTDHYRDTNNGSGMISYTTHVQNIGWQSYVSDGTMAGTEGQSLRLEGVYIKKGTEAIEKGYTGSIQYRTHIQNIGWESDWKFDGAMSGTSNRALRLEAIQIQLTGDLAEAYDVYYRVHAQNIGWMGWAKNGQEAGTAGYSYRLEGIQIILVTKGGVAPGSTENCYIDANAKYSICGTTSTTKEQMIRYFNSSASYPSFYSTSDAPTLEDFCQIYIEEAAAEGIRAEVAFCQAMKETGWLKFTGDVKIGQYNFAGIGATGGGNPGNSFSSVREGVRAQIQHLKAYATTSALNQTQVDPRYGYVQKGCAPYVEWLGIQENPSGKGWASSKNYGYQIVEMIKELKSC